MWKELSYYLDSKRRVKKIRQVKSISPGHFECWYYSASSDILSDGPASSGYKPNLMFDEVRDFSVSPPVFKHQLLK